MEQAYDWSYTAAIETLADLRRAITPQRVSADLTFATAALNAEKRFDPFEKTAAGAERRLTSFASLNVSAALLTARGARDVTEIAGAYQPESERYVKWKSLFLRESFEEHDLRLLSDDPITGWTAANVMRRLNLSPVLLAQIRAWRAA